MLPKYTVLAAPALAQSGGQLQPVQSTLQTLVNTLTGPISTSLAVLAVEIPLGILLALGRRSKLPIVKFFSVGVVPIQARHLNEKQIYDYWAKNGWERANYFRPDGQAAPAHGLGKPGWLPWVYRFGNKHPFRERQGYRLIGCCVWPDRYC